MIKERCRRISRWICLAVACLWPAVSMGNTMTVYPDEPVHPIPDTLYGIFFEDINYSADGGLYAELLKNRSFEWENPQSPSDYQHLTGWQFNALAGGEGSASLERESPLHENNASYVCLKTTAPGYTVQNLGFGDSAFRGGIPLRSGASYDISLWLRRKEGTGGVTIQLTTRAGKPLSGTFRAEPDGQWGKYAGVLVASEDVPDACLSLTFEDTGIMDLDMVSLMPVEREGADWPGGGLRKDLTEALRELHPAFLRFPGGCLAEGSYTWDNLYRWKDTVGPAEQRKENWNTWGYMQSCGIGFYEYFCLAETLGALPLPVVGSGVLCQAREPAEAPMNDEELTAWIQDILDLIEFATGNADTPWGALRAEMGHPAPFDLRYLAIGNENWGNQYFNRYEKIRAAVKEAAPDLTCIVACGPVAEGGLFNASRTEIRLRFADDTVDEHYYMDSAWFLRNIHRYDFYPRETKIFLGEYAAHEPAQGGKRPNNLYSALCEAAYLTGIERNSDVVVMSCYAPLLARIGQYQWSPDLIWFDGTRVVRTPNYYVQQLFASTAGDQVIRCEGTDLEGVYQTASRNEDGTVLIRMVNVSGTGLEVDLALEGRETGRGTLTVLAGEKNDQNTADREKVAPETKNFTWQEGILKLTLPPYGLVTLVIPPA